MGATSRFSFLLAAAVLAGACSKGGAGQPAAPPSSIEQAAAPDHPGVKAERFSVTPATVRAGQPATVSIQLDKAPPGLVVTVDWFGPDGWNVAAQSREAGGTQLSFPAPALEKPGQYHAVLRAGLDDLGDVPVTASP